MLGNIMWAKNNYTGAAWRYQLALEADPQDQEAVNTLRALKCYLKYHHSAQSQAPLETQTKVNNSYITVLPAKSDSEVMFCLQRYQGLIINRSLVY